MKKKTSFIKVVPLKIGVYLGLATLLLANLGSVQNAFAATFMTKASLMEFNMDSSGSGNVAIAFTAGASDGAGSLVIAMGSGVSAVAASQTTTTTGCTTLTGASTPLPGTLLGSTGSGTTITINNVGVLTAATSYCVILTSVTAVTNSATPNPYTATFTDGTDSTTVGYDVISNDQIVVSAVVPPSFTLAFTGGNTDSFASNLSSSADTVTNGVLLTINTNAVNGWGLWAMDTNAGLNSTIASHLISSVPTTANFNFSGSTGADHYGLGVGTDGTAHWTDSGHTGGGLSNTTFNEIASSATTASNVTTTIKEHADISGTTPAGPDYTDTVTIVGAGSF